MREKEALEARVRQTHVTNTRTRTHAHSTRLTHRHAYIHAHTHNIHTRFNLQVAEHQADIESLKDKNVKV